MPEATQGELAQAVERALLGYHSMGSGGRCDWTHLREAVSEAICGSRLHATPFDPETYPGHQMVDGINFNSLDRIVTAFVDAALQPPADAELDALRKALDAIHAARLRNGEDKGYGWNITALNRAMNEALPLLGKPVPPRAFPNVDADAIRSLRLAKQESRS